MKSTHYPECWKDHHKCALAEVERLRDEVLRWKATAAFVLESYDDKNSVNLQNGMDRIWTGLLEST